MEHKMPLIVGDKLFKSSINHEVAIPIHSQKTHPHNIDPLYAVAFTEEDAIRIVACVNACEGFPTEELEDETFEDVILTMSKEHVEEMNVLAKQRDALLAALKLVAAEVTDGVRPTSADSHLPTDVVREVQEAISSVEHPAQRNALRDDVYVAGAAA